MANVTQSLTAIMALPGAIGTAMVDLNSGMTLGCAGGNDEFNVELAAAANTEVVRAKMNAMEALNLNTSIEDILVTMGTQFHVVVPFTAGSNPLFLYVALDKTKANLAMARLKAKEVVGKVQL